jgi:hypothetical protein
MFSLRMGMTIVDMKNNLTNHYSRRDFDPSLRVGFLVKRCTSLLSKLAQPHADRSHIRLKDTFSQREVVALVSSLQRLGEQLQEFVSTLPSTQPRLTASKLDLALAKINDEQRIKNSIRLG